MNMADQFNGVQSITITIYPKTLYVHSAAYLQNLVVSISTGIKPVCNCLGVIEKAHVFFNTTKRKCALQNEIESQNNILSNVKR